MLKVDGKKNSWWDNQGPTQETNKKKKKQIIKQTKNEAHITNKEL